MFYFPIRRFSAWQIEVLAVEVGQGTQARFESARVELATGRIAVEVDDITRVRSEQCCRAKLAREIEQTVDVKIGLPQRQAGFVHPRGHVRRQVGSDMRGGDDQRRVARMKIKRGHGVRGLDLGGHGFS